ncbi:MAG TPA: glycosyltransferase family 2 protein [Bacteroidales bacterium]|nr:glycosyltransferase family 2 protein [Bacteroidales bacterium]HPS17944.1 glycosyltransferase family 2 protein [Bacteroidales bacterium]
MTIYFLIPVYNEAANLSELAVNITSALPSENKFYLFVDDGSADNSVNIIKEKFSDKPYFIITKEKNEGPGDSFNRGFEWILQHSENNEDIVITLEADNTSDIHLLPKMYSILNTGFDLVLASVYAQGGGFDKTSFLRRLISSIANMMMRFVFDIKILTLSSFYRAYKVDLLRKIKNQYQTVIEEKGFISMLEILIKSIRLNANIIEVPMILYSKKRKGKSKMKKLKTMMSYFRFMMKSGKYKI